MASAPLDPRARSALDLQPIFSAIPGESWDAILARASTASLPAGTVLGQAGEPAVQLIIVLSGHVKVFVPIGSGGEGLVDILGPGGIFGESAITGVSAYPASAVTLGPVDIVTIPGEAISSYLIGRVDLMCSMMGAISRSLRSLLAQLTELKLKTTTQRLAMFLIELCDAGQGAALIQLPYPKRIVAMKLGMTPESLSRALAKLEPLGVQAQGRTGIAIRDCAGLADYCGYLPPEKDGAS